MKNLLRTMRPGRLLTTLALPAVLAAHASAIQVLDIDLFFQSYDTSVIWAGPNLNAMIGADRFYAAGYTGGRSVAAVIEPGTASAFPEAMGGLSAILTSPTVSPIYYGHATYTASLLAGRYSGRDDGAVYLGDASGDLSDPNNFQYANENGHVYQDGIAPGSALWSGGFATGTDSQGDRDDSPEAFMRPYLTAMAAGVGGRTADVISNSWGGASTDVTQYPVLVSGAGWLNAMAAQHPQTTLVFAAGNRGLTGAVNVQAANDNVISVGVLSLGGYAHPYETVDPVSSRAPADYDGPDGHVAGVRARVDLVAQGDGLFAPTLGGAALGYPAGIGDNLYDLVSSATSWATPLVSGGVALLKDVARDRFAGDDGALDTRVTKAVLMNSADKLAGWDNGQALSNGVVTTSQALDYAQGAGRLNLGAAFDQFTSGTTDLPGLGGGAVEKIGWDFGSVADSAFVDYDLGALGAGDSLTATLVWFADVSTVGAGMDVSQDAFTNLDLQVLRDGALVAESNAAYITTQHLSLGLAQGGDYTIRVRWAGDRYDFVGKATTTYSLAWSAQAVPEPASMAALGLGALTMIRRRKRA